MTLDVSAFASSVKGHFCSVLLSNIIGYLRFCGLNKRLTWSGFHCFSSDYWLSGSGFVFCFCISERLLFARFLFAFADLKSAFLLFSKWSLNFCWLASLHFSFGAFLQSASFLTCFLLFGSCFLLSSVAFGSGICLSVLQLLFWSFWHLPFSTQCFTSLRWFSFLSFLRLFPVLPYQLQNVFRNFMLPFPDAQFMKGLSLSDLCSVIWFSAGMYSTGFCFPLFITRKRKELVHYLHSSHLELSLRRSSLRVGVFFFVPLL